MEALCQAEPRLVAPCLLLSFTIVVVNENVFCHAQHVTVFMLSCSLHACRRDTTAHANGPVGTVPGHAAGTGRYGCMHIENRGVRPPKSLTRWLFVDAAYDGQLAVSVHAAEQLQLELEFLGTRRWHGHDWAADS